MGPVHPHDPVITEWGFAEQSTSSNLFEIVSLMLQQKG